MSGSPEVKSSRQLQEVLRVAETAVEMIAGERMCLALFVFPLDRPGVAQYVSNCQRTDVAAALRYFLQRWAQGMPDVPAHERQ